MVSHFALRVLGRIIPTKTNAFVQELAEVAESQFTQTGFILCALRVLLRELCFSSVPFVSSCKLIPI